MMSGSKRLLEGSWDFVNKGVPKLESEVSLTIVTLCITLLTKSHDPPSTKAAQSPVRSSPRTLFVAALGVNLQLDLTLNPKP